MSAPDNGHAEGGTPEPAPAPRPSPAAKPPSGLPPASPGLTPPRSSGRRSMDGGSGRRSMDGGARRGRHMVEVPEGAERHEGLVVSRQEKFGFIKCSTHEGRYFFHVNDTDGAAAYGCTVSFVVARDLTTGKDVAYSVRTLAPPAAAPGAGTPGPASAGPASRSSTPDHAAAAAAAGASSLYRGAGSEGEAAPAGGGGEGEGAHPHVQSSFLRGGPGGHASAGRGAGAGRGPGATYEHFGAHRQPSPATQRDWRLPAREAAFAAAQAERAAGGGEHYARGRSHGPSPSPSVASSGGLSHGHGHHHGGLHGLGASAAADQAAAAAAAAAAAGAPGAQPVIYRYRGTVAQVARAGKQHQQDDGLLLYIDEQGAQQQARYGNWRLAEGTHRLEPGDVVDFAVQAYPGAAPGHRKAAVEVRFMSKGMVHSPSLEALAAAAEAPGGDPLRGRQLGRVALLKKEFGFIRQMERPGDMFFHFSQLEGWGPEDVKVGDDVEYTIRRDRNDPNKLSAVQIRRAPPGSVVFELVGEQVLRGVVLERPTMGKQYGATSGLIEYTLPEAEGGEGGGAAGGEGGGEGGGAGGPPPGLPKARLPFMQQDVQQGSGSLRPGDCVTFRVATNLQAAKAAALASVPGAAQYAGRRAVEVSMVRYAGTVAQVNRERQFGFLLYGEDQLLPPGVTTAAAAEAAAATQAAGEAPAPAEGEGEGAAAADGSGAPAPALAEGGGEGTAAADSSGAPAPAPAAEGSETKPAAAAAAAAAAGAEPAKPQAPRTRIFFHFKEVAGQYILKPGDEVAFVLHTNLKSGELNAQRVRRTKEGPELPEPEPAPRREKRGGAGGGEEAVPAVNPNRVKYSGNLTTGGYKQPKIAKGPDGTRGFEFSRAHAVVPRLPGVEAKEAEKAAAEAAAAQAAAEAAAAEAAAKEAEAAAAAAAAAAPPPGLAPTPAQVPVPHPHPVHLMHHGPHPPLPSAAVAVPIGSAARALSPMGRMAAVPPAVPVPVTLPAPAAAAAAPVAAVPEAAAGSEPGWQGAAPLSQLAAMTLADASAAEAAEAKRAHEAALAARLSAEAPAFVPKVASSGSLDKAAGAAAAQEQAQQAVGEAAAPGGDGQ